MSDMQDSHGDRQSNISVPYEIRHAPQSASIVGSWFVMERATNIHVQVFRSREEAIAWARRVAGSEGGRAPHAHE